MARVPEITTREQLPTEHHAIFDEIAESRGRVSGPFPVLLNSPEMAVQVARLGHHVRFGHHFEPWLFEIAVLTAAREWDCLFEWGAHAVAAEKAGVRPDVIAAIAERRAPDGLGEQEALIVRFVQELLRQHRVSPPVYDAVAAWLGTAGVVDLAATIGYYVLLACVMDTAEVQPPPSAPVLPEADSAERPQPGTPSAWKEAGAASALPQEGGMPHSGLRPHPRPLPEGEGTHWFSHCFAGPHGARETDAGDGGFPSPRAGEGEGGGRCCHRPADPRGKTNEAPASSPLPLGEAGGAPLRSAPPGEGVPPPSIAVRGA